ncbi:hypothetical protein PCE1_001087 [Barthelona sp. PCE]
MKLQFDIHYRVSFGNMLFLRVVDSSQEILTDSAYETAEGHKDFTMSWVSDDLWTIEIETLSGDLELKYLYVVQYNDRDYLIEPSPHHQLSLSNTTSKVHIFDQWRLDSSLADRIAGKACFEKVIFREEASELVKLNPPKGTDRITLSFRVYCPRKISIAKLSIVGDCSEFGEWDIADGIQLKHIGDHIFAADVVVRSSSLNSAYKLVMHTNQEEVWENGENRNLYFPVDGANICVCDLGVFRYPDEDLPRGFGVNLPLFSVRTDESCGCGEYGDLPKLVDWVKSMGARMIQLLPVSDTRVFDDFKDSYPYKPLSVLALHPIYLTLRLIPDFEKVANEYGVLAKQLDSEKKVMYVETLALKMKYLRELFNLAFDDETGTFIDSDVATDVQLFYDESFWLPSYSAFLVYKNEYGSSDFRNDWPAEFSKFDESMLESIKKDPALFKEYQFNVWIQYHCDKQLSEGSEYAAKHSVVLKGDVPIGVAFRSVDAWAFPELFRLHMSTGAPPDQFSAEGQNWGFPPYDWDKMAEDDYAWWRSRLHQMSRYFHAFRIDHVLGMFRLWENPREHKAAILGRYQPTVKFTKHDFSFDGLWDLDRYAQPHITDEVIASFTADPNMIESVKKSYLQTHPTVGHRYVFRPEFANSEKALYAHYNKCIEGIDSEEVRHWFKIELSIACKLFNNRTLALHKEDGEEFYCPLYTMQQTESFNALPHYVREHFIRYHTDYHYGSTQLSVFHQAAQKRFPMISSTTNMLICGEDLGAIPAGCADVMMQYDVLGLRIQRMPEKGLFSHPDDYEQLIVASPSTHDMPPIRQWWVNERFDGVNEHEHNREQAQTHHPKMTRFYAEILGKNTNEIRFDDDPKFISDLTNAIFDQHIYSPAMWTVFLVQDLMYLDTQYYPTDVSPTDEIINRPDIPEFYWRYRMHVPLETLLEDRDFSKMVKKRLAQANRTKMY